MKNMRLENLVSAFNAYEDCKYQETINLCNEILKTSTDWPPAYIMLGRAYLKTNNIKLAKEQFKIALSFDAENSDALNCIGVALCHQAEYENAFLYFEKADKSSTDRITYYKNLQALEREEKENLLEKLQTELLFDDIDQWEKLDSQKLSNFGTRNNMFLANKMSPLVKSEVSSVLKNSVKHY